jgi:hypothetical protein
MKERTGLQRLLGLAARDPIVRRRVVEERSGAALAAGVTLELSERAVLDTIPADQLEATVDALVGVGDGPAVEPFPFVSLHGHLRDLPGGSPVRGHGAAPPSPIKGHSAKLPLAAGALLLGAGVVGGSLLLTTGIRPDVPPPTSARGGTAAPAHAEPKDAGIDAKKPSR